MKYIGKIRIVCFMLVFLGSLAFGMLSCHAVVLNENTEEGKGVLIETIKYANNCSTGSGEAMYNAEDACIEEHGTYDGTYHNGNYNGHSYDSHWAATKVNDADGTSRSTWHWFEVDLGGNYNVCNIALGLAGKNASNIIDCHVYLYTASGENAGTISANNLGITSTMGKYFLNGGWDNADTKLTNIRKLKIHIRAGDGGATNITTNIYYINVYRKLTTTDTFGRFCNMNSINYVESTYGTIYEGHHIDTYHDESNPPVITYDNGADTYYTAEHWVLGDTHDYIKFTPKKATGDDYYTITVSRAASRRFEAASFTVWVKINPKTLTYTVSADNKIYDGTTDGSGSVILDGIVNNDDVTATGDFTFADKNVGTGKPVSVANIALGGTTAGNYTLDTTTGSTTAAILAKPITITAKDQTITYGGNIALGVNQVTVATLASGDSLTAITLTAGDTNAGKTDITPSAATIKEGNTDVTNNYNITYQKGTLTINKKQVTKPTIVNCTYNGAVQYGVNPQTAATGYSYSGTTNATNAETYTATATLDSNHMWSDNTTGAVNLQWSIAKLGITITAKNQEITYGGNIALGVNQVTVATLASGDSLTAITLTAGDTNAGKTDITPSAATIKEGNTDVTNNYNITYQKGTLTINKKQVTKPTIVNCTYNGAVQYGVNPQTAATGYSYSGTTNATNAETYTATATLDSNHMWSDETTEPVTINWSIAKLGITITAKNQKITYGGNIATGLDQVTVATLASGDSLTAITLTAGNTNAGKTDITPSAATIKEGNTDVTSNYSITYVNGNLDIAQKEITPMLVAEDRLYNGTTEAKGTIDLPDKVSGDDVSATYGACTFNSSLVGTRTATATGIALIGSAASNYTLKDTSATDTANITKAVLIVYVNSDLVNTAEEALIKGKTTQAGAAENITLPANYIIENANGSYGSISNETYTRSGVYYNALGVIEDTVISELVIETIPCVTVTYHITTGQNAVYGNNITENGEQTTITTYVNNSADSWQIVDKARKIATNAPATATLNVYLKEGEHLLVDTAIGVYYGRMDVTVTKVNESTVLAEDKIDAFFPANHEDDFRVSKLQLATNTSYNANRGDYWSDVKPFTAPSTGVYTFTLTVTGKSYLHSLDTRYTQNLPAQKPVTELLKFTINGTEMHGIDAQK